MSDNQEQVRFDKLAAMRALGEEPYTIPESFNPVKQVPNKVMFDSCKNSGKEWTADTGPLSYADGRVMLRRTMGNLHFLTIRDDSGDIQIAISKKRVNEKDWELAQLIDLADNIYVVGNLAPTQTGEPTIWATEFSVASKSLIPPPSKVDGITDPELRFRRRSQDLITNLDALNLLRTRSRIVRAIREELWNLGFEEVETPILQPIHGGAAATPFQTHHKALDIPLYLRIAPELYLKRLIVGGMSKIFEIGRNFRNEGISPKHNPEFTALELYAKYNNYASMAAITEILVRLAFTVAGNTLPSDNFRRVTMTDLVKAWIDSQSEVFTIADIPESYYEIYQEHVEKTIVEPTFITHFPASVIPLAKEKDGYAEAFELIINGMEVGCGYSEQTDPIIQDYVFEKQIQKRVEGYAIKDQDFLDALKYGMPPTGGLGIGIDRLVMLATNTESIRDVITFPLLRPLK